MTRMHRERSQLLIVDMQERLLPAVQNPSGTAAVCQRVIQTAKRLGVPITASEQYPQGIGPTIASLREEIGNEVPVFSKAHFSCMRDDALRDRLHSLCDEGRNQVVIAGIEAHICVTQTALDLAAAGFETFVVADGIASRTVESRELALERMRHAGVIAVDSEMAIYEWLEKAGTPEFKDILRLVKEQSWR